MEEAFTALSKRQTMLLLTALTFGGSEADEVLDHLTEGEAELLRHRAGEIIKVPRSQRVPLLVQEMKRLVSARKALIQAAEPEQLAKVLRRERPVLIEAVLRAMPSASALEVRRRLALKPAKLIKEPSPQVLAVVRSKLEERLTRSSSRKGAFRFTDIVTLQVRELWAICDRMGARVLATAMAGLSEKDRNKLFESLPPDQRSIASRAAQLAGKKALPAESAKTLLSVYGGTESASMALRLAGVHRLARACLAESAQFVSQFLDRHPNEFGRTVLRFIREETGRPISGDGGRQDIVEQMERLADKGVIDRPIRLAPPTESRIAQGPNTLKSGSPAGGSRPPKSGSS